VSLRVNTNVSSIHAQNALSTNTRETQESFAKLASGERITKAADDAAGLAISEKMKADIRSSRQANRNANDGMSMIQTAEGGLNEASSILGRMKELSIQAASDTLTDTQRSFAGFEYQNLKLELERIAQSTEFNGRKLLDGSGSRMDFQVGVGANSADDYISFQPSKLDAKIQSLGVNTASINSKFEAQQSINTIESAINKVSSHRSMLGSIQNRLLTSSSNLQIYNENMSSANNRIRDLDYAEETAKIAKNRILGDASTAVLTQANMSGKDALKLV
jgi:flagellin